MNGQEHAMALIPAWFDRAAGLCAVVSCGTSTSHARLVDLSQLIMTPTGQHFLFKRREHLSRTVGYDPIDLDVILPYQK